MSGWGSKARLSLLGALVCALFLACSGDDNGGGPSGPVADGGPAIGADGAVDGAAPCDCSTLACQLPPNDPTTVTSLYESTRFVYEGVASGQCAGKPIQSGVAAGTIVAAHVSVLRGNVLDAKGAPVAGATLTVVGHPEFGQTASQPDGSFTLVVDGGGQLTVRYVKAGYVDVQRHKRTSWNAYAHLPDVVMLPVSATTAAVALGATSSFADGEAVTDASGKRTPHVYFAPNTTANAIAANGTKTALSSFHLRMTELTTGTTGEQSMPADLPTGSAYTYCTAFDVDEAPDAVRVELSPPAVAYVDNFLSFASGTGVPAGAYAPGSDTWEAANNGVALKVLSVGAGTASIDANGDGQADTAAQLATLGITSYELATIATKLSAGASFWRVPVPHFTLWDFNLGYAPPAGATSPGSKATNQNHFDCSSLWPGSIIHCESQGLGERNPLPGTGLSLMYSSERTRAYVPSRTVDIQLSDGSISPLVTKISMQVDVAGQEFKQDFPPSPNLKTTFTWDGNDAFGRPVQGDQSILVTVDNHYDGVYIYVAQFGYRGNGTKVVTDTNQPAGTRTTVSLETVTSAIVSAWDERGLGNDGWTLDAHHVLDPDDNVLYLGTGQKRSVETFGTTLSLVAGVASVPGYTGDGGPARKAAINRPHGLVVTPEGVAYIADEFNHAIRKIDTSGVMTTFAGTGIAGFSGDGGPARSAQLQNPMGLALGTDGTLYVADSGNFRVRKIATDGTISTLAGSGVSGNTGDNGPATAATFADPHALAVGPDGSVYVADAAAARIRRISSNGIISLIAGNGYDGDGGPAATAAISEPTGITVGPDGTIYFVGRIDATVRKIDPSGNISTVAGVANVFGATGDGGPAKTALLNEPHTVDIGPDGSLYITDEGNVRVRRIDSSGTISTIAGGGSGSIADGAAPTGINLGIPRVIYVSKDGSIWVADYGAQELYRITIPRPLTVAGNYVVPSLDGREAYVFDIHGKHLKTVDAITGVTLLAFDYDAQGRLASAVDRDGNITSFTRDVSGCLTDVTSPWGHHTKLTCDGNGWLASALDPANSSTNYAYSADGLLQNRHAPNGDANTFTYDGGGRLVKDAEPWGGFKTLARSDLTNGWSVNLTTAQGRSTGHDTVDDVVAGRTRTTHLPDGHSVVVNRALDQQNHVAFENGATLSTRESADPRFDKMAPVTASGTYATPGGNGVAFAGSRAVTLGSSGDPTAPATYSETASVGGNAWTRAYDATTRTWLLTTAAGRSEQVALDAKGHVIEVDAPNRAPVRAAYDGQGRVTGVTQDARTAGFVYDARSNLQSSTDPLGHTWSYAYDAIGRTTGITRADSQKIGISYDVNGNVTSVTPPGKTAHDFTYTAGDVPQAYKPPAASGTLSNDTLYAFSQDLDLSTLTRADSQAVSFGYDTAGRLSSTTSSVGTTALSWNPTTGELAGVADPNGEAISFTTDGDLLTGVTWSGPVAGTVSYGFDTSLRVNQETAGGAAISYGYDADSLLTTAGSETLSRFAADGYLSGTSLGAASDAYTYSEYGELATHVASISGTAIFSQNFTRDAVGRVLSLQETIDGATHTYGYAYDLADRLATVTIDGAASSSYTYDANGNATSATVRGVAATGVYDAQDRVASYGGATYDWTAQGELLAKHLGSATTTYATDSLGRLQSVVLPGGSTVSYVYDGSNRRVGKKIGGVLQQGFLYRDAIKPVVELDGSGSVVSRFVYGSSALVPDYVIRGGNTYRIFTDQLGSPRVVVDVSSGSVVERIDYDERGITLNDTNAGFIPFGFAGGIVDRDTGLIRFGARDYDPGTGRWIEKDTIGFDGGANFYAYTRSDPVNWVDPDGLTAVAMGAGWAADAELFGTAAELGALATPIGWVVLGAGSVYIAYELICDPALTPPVNFATGGPKDAEKWVRKDRGPKGIDRIDRPKVTGEQWHAHSAPGEGSPSVNLDGTPKHGDNSWITSKIADFLRSYGWNL